MGAMDHDYCSCSLSPSIYLLTSIQSPQLKFTAMVVYRFDKAVVALFWTAAGMGLPDSVDYKYPDGSINFAVVFFFASFILILNWTLLQVYHPPHP